MAWVGQTESDGSPLKKWRAFLVKGRQGKEARVDQTPVPALAFIMSENDE